MAAFPPIFFIMLVALHESWLAVRWQPIRLTVPRTCVRSALVINLHTLGISTEQLFCIDCTMNIVE